MIRTERCPVFVFRRLTAHLFCGPEPLPHHFFLRTGGIFYQAEKNVSIPFHSESCEQRWKVGKFWHLGQGLVLFEERPHGRRLQEMNETEKMGWSLGAGLRTFWGKVGVLV